MSLRVTVGIPTMNNADTIEATLRQLLDGTRQPDRILVVDASTDETPDIVERVAGEYEVPIDVSDQSDRGRGVGAARQDIYERFEGDVLACLDTDRSVSDDWLEKRVAFHEANPDVDVLSAAPEDVDERVTDPKTPYFFQQMNGSLTSDALDRVQGWDPWLPRGEDWDMQIRLWKSGATAHARGDLYGESMGADSHLDNLKASMGRPSSVAFLRKYGSWYARFHPLHPLGDALSVVALACLVFALPLLLVAPPVGLLALVTLVTLTVAYVFVGHRHNRDGIVTRKDPMYAARFFVLGVTAFRELVLAEDYPWNYGGVGDDER